MSSAPFHVPAGRIVAAWRRYRYIRERRASRRREYHGTITTSSAVFSGIRFRQHCSSPVETVEKNCGYHVIRTLMSVIAFSFSNQTARMFVKNERESPHDATARRLRRRIVVEERNIRTYTAVHAKIESARRSCCARAVALPSVVIACYFVKSPPATTVLSKMKELWLAMSEKRIFCLSPTPNEVSLHDVNGHVEDMYAATVNS